MLTVAFAKRLAPEINVNVCHPGDVNSALSNSLSFGGHETPEQGAATPVWLATQAVGSEKTGKYFEHLKELPCRFSQDKKLIEDLYEKCLAYC